MFIHRDQLQHLRVLLRRAPGHPLVVPQEPLQGYEVPQVERRLQADVELDEAQEAPLQPGEEGCGREVVVAHKVDVPDGLVLPDLAGQDQGAQRHEPPGAGEDREPLSLNYSLDVNESHYADLWPEAFLGDDPVEKGTD